MNTQQLRKHLQEEARKLSEQAIRPGATVSERQMAKLEHLSRLIAIYEQNQPKPGRVRWPVITILLVTILGVGVLLSLRIASTEIEADLTLSELQFTVANPTVLTDTLVFSTLGVSALKDIQLPRVQTLSARTLQAVEERGFALRLAAVQDETQKSTLTLTALLVPANTLVKIGTTDLPNQYRVFLGVQDNAELTLQVSVKGTIEVAISGMPVEYYTYAFPQSIQMKPATSQLSFDITLPEGTQTSFSPYLPVRNLAFVKIDQFMGTSDTYIRRISTVLSGVLYLIELNNKEHQLLTREGLEFGESEGVIRLLQLAQDQVKLQFHGKVQDLSTGWEANRRDLMPNYLEWLSARHTIAVLWSSTVSAFLLLLGIWRWWRKAE